jgi:hypothetical protein
MRNLSLWQYAFHVEVLEPLASVSVKIKNSFLSHLVSVQFGLVWLVPTS